MRFYDNLLGHNILDPKLQLNNHGHRCKNLEDINLRNYLLFAGDNVALDFNLPLEETYPYLVSKELKVDYYNLSIFNGGIDAIKFNLISWFTKTKFQPKAVIVSFEFLNSIITCDGAFDNFAVADYSTEKVKQILSAGETSGLLLSRKILASKILRGFIGTPIIQIEFEGKAALFNKDKVFNLIYDGELSNHKDISNLIVPVYKNIVKSLVP